MQKIALEPKDPYEVSADGSGAGDEYADLQRRYHAGVLLDSKNPYKVLDHSCLPIVLPRYLAESSGAVKDIVSPCGAVPSL